MAWTEKARRAAVRARHKRYKKKARRRAKGLKRKKVRSQYRRQRRLKKFWRKRLGVT